MKESYISKSEKQTIRIAQKLAKRLKNGNTVLLYGDLGAGKTVFVKGIVKRFAKCRVSSPSFAIVYTYEGKHFNIHHFDLYRVASLEEFFSFGGEEILFGDGIKIVEWPEKLNIFSEPTCVVRISKIDEDQRRIDIEWKN